MADYIQDENAGGLDALTNVTVAPGDLFVFGDVSDSNKAKAITLANLGTRIGADLNLSGTNTGDQVGDGVTITGAGTVGDPFVATAAGGMTNPMTTGGDLIYGGASGVATRLANGSIGQVLTSGGTTAAPTWETVAGVGDVVKVGTPANNQVGVWTGNGTIEGDAALTFDTATDLLTTVIVAATTIELGAGATDTTLSRSAAGVLAVEGVVIPSISSTNTITNKRIEPRVVSAASYTTDTGASLSVATADLFVITAQAGALLFNAPGGTPVEGQTLKIRIKDNGTARALTWNAVFRAMGVALPSTTVLSKTLYLGFIYNFTDTKWDLVASAQEA